MPTSNEREMLSSNEALKELNRFTAGTDFRRQKLTSTDKSTIKELRLIWPFDPQHRYSNEAERAN